MSGTKQEKPLTGKVALVTGGSRGIGAAIANAWPRMAPTSPSPILKARTPRRKLSMRSNAGVEGARDPGGRRRRRCGPQRR